MIIIIDYGLGNLGSVKNALDKLGVDSMVSKSVKEIEAGSALILPGVGSATEGMKNLRKSGLDKVILKQIKLKKPILGICLGMQLLFSLSEEGNTECLNVIEGKVKKFNNNPDIIGTGLKVPQIGWNRVKVQSSNFKDQNLFNDIPNNSYYYFVHSYYCQPDKSSIVTGITSYGIDFCSSFQKENIFGVQFHPEKSGENGLKLLKNFVDIVYANNTGN
jgi:imidazole glycerol-phosphate synthase subunit HisH